MKPNAITTNTGRQDCRRWLAAEPFAVSVAQGGKQTKESPALENPEKALVTEGISITPNTPPQPPTSMRGDVGRYGGIWLFVILASNANRKPEKSQQTCFSKAELPGIQFAESFDFRFRGFLLGYSFRGMINLEKGIPRDSEKFRELPQGKQASQTKNREPRGLNCQFPKASNLPVKRNRFPKVNSVRTKGSKKAAGAHSLTITEVLTVIVQSFKSCRGHHLNSPACVNPTPGCKPPLLTDHSAIDLLLCVSF